MARNFSFRENNIPDTYCNNPLNYLIACNVGRLNDIIIH